MPYRPSLVSPTLRPVLRPLVQQVFGYFDPLKLDPYLYFDTRESMVGTLENPTLDLDPSKPETLDVITATRSGTATYTDANGVIQEAAADTVRVDYTQGAELTPTKFQRVGQTDYFSSPNTTINTTLQYVTGPTGQLDAVRVSEDATTDYHYLAMRADVVSGTTYAISFYIKQGSYSTARVFGQSAYMPTNTTVNFSTETASNGIMENVGDGWYRVTFTGTAISTGTMIVYATVTNLNSYAGDVNNFTDYYGFQVEEGTTASDFVANTTGSPKFITGATYGPRVPMMLVEPSSENLVEYSEDFSDSSWDKQSGGTGVDPVVTPNSAISPDGTQNASKVVFNTAGGTTTSDESFLTARLPTVIGGTYTQSVYLKGDVGGEQILIRGAGGSAYTTITLTTDWVRYEGTEVEPNNTDAYLQIGLRQGLSGVVINQSTTVYIWGAQFEEGSVATSYIPTSGSTVVRSSDELVISGSDFTDFFNNSEGTIYCEFEYDFEHAFEYVYNIRQDVNNEIRTQLTPTNDIRTRYTVADSHIAQPSPEGAVQGSLNRHAFSYKTNNFRGNVNGGNDEQDLSGNASLIPVEMQIGGRGNGISNIKFKRLIYWPYHSDSL